MKVLNVIETLAPNYGGPVTVVTQLAEAEAQSGLDVEILTTNADMPSGRYCEAGRSTLNGGTVPVTYCSVQLNILRLSAGIASFLHRNSKRFDIIHVHGLYRFPQSYAAAFARNTNKPYVITPHGALDPFLYARSSRSLALKRIYERWVDFPNLNGASALHFTTEDERQLVSRLGLQAPSFVAPNGLNWKPYEILPPRGALRARYGLADGPLILFLGRLHLKKGLPILIDAVNVVRRRHSDVRLLIAGPESGEYGRVIREQTSQLGMADTTIFSGPLYGADVTQAYVDADVFALPSHTENFGMTVAEAMACATPVVISDQVNIHAEVTSAGAGIVTHCDANEVAAALSSLLDDRTRRQSMGQAGRRLVQGRYSWPSIVQTITHEYEGIVRRARNSGKKI